MAFVCNVGKINATSEKLGGAKKTPFSLDVNRIEPLESGALSTSGVIGETRRVFGGAMGIRTVRGVFGEAGAPWWNRFARGVTTVHNENARVASRYLDYVKPIQPNRPRFMGVNSDLDLKITDIAEQIGTGGVYTGPAGKYTEAELNVGRAYRAHFDDLYNKGRELGVDFKEYVQQYIPMMRRMTDRFMKNLEKEPDPELERWFSGLTPIQVRFVHQMTRTGRGFEGALERRSSALLMAYADALHKNNILKPIVERAEEEWVNPTFNVSFVKSPRTKELMAKVNDPVGYNYYRETVGHMFGEITHTDRQMVYTMQNMWRSTLGLVPALAKYEPDVGTLYKAARFLQADFYSGAIGSLTGGRPSSTIRHMTRIVPSFAALGPRWVLEGLGKAFDPATFKRYQEMNMLSSPFESLMEGVGLASNINAAVQKTVTSTLALFRASDAFIRMGTLGASEAKFNHYLNSGMIENLPISRPMRETIQNLVKRGNTDQARIEFMYDNLARLEYIYGAANRPRWFRGALGGLMGMFLSYPVNTYELYSEFARGTIAVGPGQTRNFMPLLRLLGGVSAAIWAGKEFLNADLTTSFLHGILPDSVAIPNLMTDTYRAGSQNIKAAVGNVFGIEESQDHKRKRTSAVRDLGRDLVPFVPSGIFVFSDIPRAIDEGNVRRMFTLNPLAEESDRLHQEHLADLRARDKEASQNYLLDYLQRARGW